MNIKICHLNIRSLTAHFREFLNFIKNKKFDILSNAKKLKSIGIGVSKDLIPEDYEKQKVLRKYLKVVRETKKQKAKKKQNHPVQIKISLKKAT